MAADGEDRGRWIIHDDRLTDENSHIRVSLADVEPPDGTQFTQSVFRLRRCAMIAILDEAGTGTGILLLRRHRFIIDRWVWEIPGGYVDDGEDGPAAALREAEEETGWRPRSARFVLSFQPMIGNADFPQDLYVAHGADRVREPDTDETAEVRWVRLDDAAAMVSDGQIPGPPASSPFSMRYCSGHSPRLRPGPGTFLRTSCAPGARSLPGAGRELAAGIYRSVADVVHRKVDVGGRSLHVAQSGSGAPAVILEAGSGCGSDLWEAVQEQTADLTAVYSYDRAGHGSSDPGEPWTLEVWVADLERWLAAAAVPPPYVLAGHSLGGHIVRAFAARHPGDVAGMVLVDVRHEDAFGQLPESFLARLAELAPRDTEQARRADELVRGLPATGGLPVSVLTHGRADWIPDDFGVPQAGLDQAEQTWQRYQRELAGRFGSASVLIARDSGHLIPAEQPDLVAGEIAAMIRRLGHR